MFSETRVHQPGTGTGARVLVMRADGGRAEVVFRPAAAGEAGRIFQISQPFMANGSLIERDRRFFYGNIGEFQVMESGGEVIGCVGIRGFGTLAELYNVCISTGWQGCGTGRLMVAGALALLHARGIPCAGLFSKTTGAWFTSLGFTRADPGRLPATRLTLVDPRRGAAFMQRPTVAAADPLDALSKIATPRVRFARSHREFRWDGSASSVLELAERNGMEIEHLCRAGICGTCCSRIIRGTAGYIDEPDADVTAGEVLLCITQPVTDLVIER
jgi:N-acetylglutamate synthase-like GNAT family acetyltransferase/ferredoxin